jgi:putative lipoic acid-binding regulatory protein
MDAQETTMQTPEDESLIAYPCSFPIKVMGLHDETFVGQMVELARQHDPAFDPDQHVVHRPSSSGKYLGLTITITAINRAQLDNLYRAYTSHPLVKYVL